MTQNDIASQVKRVNQVLEAGEPANISLDSHTGFTGYKPQYIIDALNEVFGYGGWGFEEVSNELVSTQSEKGTSVLAVAQVKVWLKGCEFQPTGYGQARVTRGDMGDAKKGAQTDAIKKALSYFSIGTRAYQGLLVAEEINLAEVKEQVRTQRLATNPQQWAAWKRTVLGQDVADNKLSVAHLAKMKQAVDQSKKEKSEAA